MSKETHVLDLLPAYALGSLDSDEARRVEEHLSSCLVCRNERMQRTKMSPAKRNQFRCCIQLHGA